MFHVSTEFTIETYLETFMQTCKFDNTLAPARKLLIYREDLNQHGGRVSQKADGMVIANDRPVLTRGQAPRSLEPIR
jgi:hypothetical protein